MRAPYETGTFFGLRSPYIDFCGFEPVSGDEDGVIARLSPRPEMMNARGVTHGGMLVAFLDVTLGVAAMLASRAITPAITIDIATSFLAPATGLLECRARVLRGGGKITFCEGEIFSQQRICAKAMATYILSSEKSETGQNQGHDKGT